MADLSNASHVSDAARNTVDQIVSAARSEQGLNSALSQINDQRDSFASASDYNNYVKSVQSGLSAAEAKDPYLATLIATEYARENFNSLSTSKSGQIEPEDVAQQISDASQAGTTTDPVQGRILSDLQSRMPEITQGHRRGAKMSDLNQEWVNNYSKESLAQATQPVLAELATDPELFNRIAFGKPSIKQKDIENALKKDDKARQAGGEFLTDDERSAAQFLDQNFNELKDPRSKAITQDSMEAFAQTQLGGTTDDIVARQYPDQESSTTSSTDSSPAAAPVDAAGCSDSETSSTGSYAQADALANGTAQDLLDATNNGQGVLSALDEMHYEQAALPSDQYNEYQAEVYRQLYASYQKDPYVFSQMANVFASEDFSQLSSKGQMYQENLADLRAQGSLNNVENVLVQNLQGRFGEIRSAHMDGVFRDKPGATTADLNQEIADYHGKQAMVQDAQPVVSTLMNDPDSFNNLSFGKPTISQKDLNTAISYDDQAQNAGGAYLSNNERQAGQFMQNNWNLMRGTQQNKIDWSSINNFSQTQLGQTPEQIAGEQ